MRIRRNPFFLLIFLSYSHLIYAQTQDNGLSFTASTGPSVLLNQTPLSFPFAGGLNNPQLSSLDINADGLADIFIFDRTGNRCAIFIHQGPAGSYNFKYEPDLSAAFPHELREWALLVDYDKDGLPDIFGYTSHGVSVWKNLGLFNGKPIFQLITQALPTRYGIFPANLFVSLADIPAITDVDRDGDIDIITFNILGGCVEWHKNLSMELYGVPDSLHFVMQTDNWGKFREGFSLYEIELDSNCTNNQQPTDNGKPRHAGSTLLVHDLNGDGLPELVMGDADVNNLAVLINGGNLQDARFTAFSANFPADFQLAQAVIIPTFPAAFYLDVNADGVKDLVAAPNDMGVGENRNGIWMYLNHGNDSIPDFQLITQGFLQNGMIDLGSGAFPRFVFLSGQGVPDLIVGNDFATGQSGRLSWFKPVPDPSGNWHYEWVSSDLAQISNFQWTHLIPAFADLDGDGDMDMILGESSGKLHYFENTGSSQQPQFILVQQNFAGINVGADAAPDIFDLDLDGKPDLIVGNRNGRIHFFKNHGNIQVPLFNSTPDIPNLGNVSTVNPQAGSQGYAIPCFFTKNGKTELLLGSLQGTFYHYDQIHDPNNQLQNEFRLLSTNAGFIRTGIRSAPAVYDFDNDGFPELVAGNYAGGLHWFNGRAYNMHTETFSGLEKRLVFPNPGSSLIHFIPDLPEGVEVSAINIHGQKVQIQVLYEGFDTSHLKPGFYILKLSRSDGSFQSIPWIKTE